MKWTTKPPTEGGYYWVKWALGDINDNIDIVHVTVSKKNNEVYITRFGWDDNPSLDDFSSWCGPIQEPDDE